MISGVSAGIFALVCFSSSFSRCHAAWWTVYASVLSWNVKNMPEATCKTQLQRRILCAGHVSHEPECAPPRRQEQDHYGILNLIWSLQDRILLFLLQTPGSYYCSDSKFWICLDVQIQRSRELGEWAEHGWTMLVMLRFRMPTGPICWLKFSSPTLSQGILNSWADHVSHFSQKAPSSAFPRRYPQIRLNEDESIRSPTLGIATARNTSEGATFGSWAGVERWDATQAYNGTKDLRNLNNPSFVLDTHLPDLKIGFLKSNLISAYPSPAMMAQACGIAPVKEPQMVSHHQAAHGEEFLGWKARIGWVGSGVSLTLDSLDRWSKKLKVIWHLPIPSSQRFESLDCPAESESLNIPPSYSPSLLWQIEVCLRVKGLFEFTISQIWLRPLGWHCALARPCLDSQAKDTLHNLKNYNTTQQCKCVRMIGVTLEPIYINRKNIGHWC